MAGDYWFPIAGSQHPHTRNRFFRLYRGVTVQELAAPSELQHAEWHPMHKKRYPRSWWYHTRVCFSKKLMLMLRDKPYLKSQFLGALIMGESGR